MKFSAAVRAAAAAACLPAAAGASLRSQPMDAADIARSIVQHSKECYTSNAADEAAYKDCVVSFCGAQCGSSSNDCGGVCASHALPLFARFSEMKTDAAPGAKEEVPAAQMSLAQLRLQSKEAEGEQEAAMEELRAAQLRLRGLNGRLHNGAARQQLDRLADTIDAHIANIESFRDLTRETAERKAPSMNFLQVARKAAPEQELAKEMTHDLEMNFNRIAPFGKEDTAKELQSHAAKTQDTLVDAVENAEVAEIKRAVFRALTRLRAATIKEFDTIARLETQAIDAYNDAHHYRAENPLAHLHEDEAPVETDKLKSFH
eukprot:TRINITY_DN2151_c0_g1_i1.p1 TRINITY_DN2151_c0_g1~~TRINITY_DN2151_c0_g1_i1.p1  ORF type:complete len:342 (-),score=110.80 TRINITY_DN2151_c0_g1_i1:53-1006(-)